ncbi:GNAT family N-acetyltransferase [Leminorella richardii]|nr:GNAT family N-acetyltransferase [Leminorella richardii]
MKKTAENVTIRAITEADRQEWLSLWQQYQHFYRAKITPEVTANTFSALCEGKDICGLVAVDGSNRLLGFMHIVYHASTWSDRDYCYIEDLFVDKSARGENVAEKLFDEAYRQAEARDCSRVYWMTQEFNSSARSLYDVIGKRTSFVIYMKN